MGTLFGGGAKPQAPVRKNIPGRDDEAAEAAAAEVRRNAAKKRGLRSSLLARSRTSDRDLNGTLGG